VPAWEAEDEPDTLGSKGVDDRPAGAHRGHRATLSLVVALADVDVAAAEVNLDGVFHCTRGGRRST
jgi:hypothetical protein